MKHFTNSARFNPIQNCEVALFVIAFHIIMLVRLAGTSGRWIPWDSTQDARRDRLPTTVGFGQNAAAIFALHFGQPLRSRRVGLVLRPGSNPSGSTLLYSHYPSKVVVQETVSAGI